MGYAAGWNIMSGLTGYVNFGYSLFAGIAGYASVILIIDLGVWWLLAWFLGGVAAAIAAALLGGVEDLDADGEPVHRRREHR